MVSRVDAHVHQQLPIFSCVFRELLRRQPSFERHYHFEVGGDVRGQDHLDYYVSHVPVLSFTQLFENVILGIKQQLETQCAVVVLQN
mmetsp:Transcript_46435/g.34112  ORF Transcript_46435/g.34112 Transcript_46435/m.34112 type:complete len:87 (-) Transcript_46435:582-842(-)